MWQTVGRISSHISEGNGQLQTRKSMHCFACNCEKKEENRVLKKLNFWDKLDHINVKKNEQAFFATYFQHNKKNGKNRFLSNTEGSFNSMDNTTLTIIT